MRRDVRVGAEAQRVRVEPRRRARLARLLDAPAQPLGVRAERERDPVGDAGRELDHARTGRGDVDRHRRQPQRVEPAQPAGEAVEVDRAAAQVGRELGQESLEHRERRGLEADLEQRRVAAPDPEHGAPARERVDRGDRRRGRRRMAGDRVGDSGREPEPARRLRGERHPREHVARQVLRVGERDAVEARGFGARRELAGELGKRDGEGPDLERLAVGHRRIMARTGREKPMPRAERPDASLYYEVHGEGPADRVRARRGRQHADLVPAGAACSRASTPS